MFNNFFFFFKLRRGRQATDDNVVHAHCIVDTEDYRHPLIYVKLSAFSQ